MDSSMDGTSVLISTAMAAMAVFFLLIFYMDGKDAETLGVSPVYAGVVEETFTDSKSQMPTIYDNGGTTAVIPASDRTEYGISVDGVDYRVDERTYQRVEEGDNIEYQLTQNGEIGNIRVLADQTNQDKQD